MLITTLREKREPPMPPDTPITMISPSMPGPTIAITTIRIGR